MYYSSCEMCVIAAVKRGVIAAVKCVLCHVYVL